MFLLRKPNPNIIRAFLDSQSGARLSYSTIGATAGVPPAGYDVDHTRICLGKGQVAFEAAKAALRSWEHFHLGWVESCWSTAPIESGQVVGILGRAFGL